MCATEDQAVINGFAEYLNGKAQSQAYEEQVQRAQQEAMRQAAKAWHEGAEATRRADHAARNPVRVRAQFAEFERICNDALARPRPHAQSGPFSISQGR